MDEFYQTNSDFRGYVNRFLHLIGRRESTMKNKAMEYKEVLIGGDMASLTGYIEQITSTLTRKTVKWEITKKNNGTFDLHVEVSEAEYDYLIQHI